MSAFAVALGGKADMPFCTAHVYLGSDRAGLYRSDEANYGSRCCTANSSSGDKTSVLRP